MKPLAIAIVAVAGIAFDASIIGVGVWLMFFRDFSFWWWGLVLFLSMGQITATYKIINAINGSYLKTLGD